MIYQTLTVLPVIYQTLTVLPVTLSDDLSKTYCTTQGFMTSTKPKTQRWYLGGVAAMGAVCFTHPLDTLKVHLQVSFDIVKAYKIKREELSKLLDLSNLLGVSVLTTWSFYSSSFPADPPLPQTQTAKKGLLDVAMSTVKTNGIRGLYSGLSASLMRQGLF